MIEAAVLAPATAIDLSEMRGQQQARRALEVAAAGGHNLFMVGAPGAGKTMLARRLPTILPELSREEALEVTQIHSVAGLLRGQGLLRQRLFRAPHHSVSVAGLLGGGAAMLRPGEVSLAEGGRSSPDEDVEENQCRDGHHHADPGVRLIRLLQLTPRDRSPCMCLPRSTDLRVGHHISSSSTAACAR